jgi:hypothetical protein
MALAEGRLVGKRGRVPLPPEERARRIKERSRLSEQKRSPESKARHVARRREVRHMQKRQREQGAGSPA